jgi:hypothetical protein
MTLKTLEKTVHDTPTFSKEEMTFDFIISLGSNCEITENIRSYFNLDKAYPFDWWMTPFSSLLHLLEERFTQLFEWQNLTVSEDRQTVIDQHYNIMYHHDFKRDQDEKIRVDQIEEQLPNLKQKYTMLSQRFLTELRGKKVLFIRNRCGNDINYLNADVSTLEHKHVYQLHRQLQSALPESRISILITNLPKRPTLKIQQHGYIWWDSVVEHNDAEDYRGSVAGWQELFARNNLALTHPVSRQAKATTPSIYQRAIAKCKRILKGI